MFEWISQQQDMQSEQSRQCSKDLFQSSQVSNFDNSNLSSFENFRQSVKAFREQNKSIRFASSCISSEEVDDEEEEESWNRTKQQTKKNKLKNEFSNRINRTHSIQSLSVAPQLNFLEQGSQSSPSNWILYNPLKYKKRYEKNLNCLSSIISQCECGSSYLQSSDAQKKLFSNTQQMRTTLFRGNSQRMEPDEKMRRPFGVNKDKSMTPEISKSESKSQYTRLFTANGKPEQPKIQQEKSFQQRPGTAGLYTVQKAPSKSNRGPRAHSLAPLEKDNTQSQSTKNKEKNRLTRLFSARSKQDVKSPIIKKQKPIMAWNQKFQERLKRDGPLLDEAVIKGKKSSQLRACPLEVTSKQYAYQNGECKIPTTKECIDRAKAAAIQAAAIGNSRSIKHSQSHMDKSLPTPPSYRNQNSLSKQSSKQGPYGIESAALDIQESTVFDIRSISNPDVLDDFTRQPIKDGNQLLASSRRPFERDKSDFIDHCQGRNTFELCNEIRTNINDWRKDKEKLNFVSSKSHNNMMSKNDLKELHQMQARPAQKMSFQAQESNQEDSSCKNRMFQYLLTFLLIVIIFLLLGLLIYIILNNRRESNIVISAAFPKTQQN